MIGSGLKKLALSNGMTVAHGVAYGSLRGYAATLSEGAGFKQLILTTRFPDPAGLNQLHAELNRRNVTREFRVQTMNFTPGGIQIVFTDTVGTMKRIEAFLDWFLPLLSAAAATGVNVCAECGGQLTGGCWKLVDGVALHVHESCGQKLQAAVAEEAQAPRPGSYLTGILGAFLGAAIGAVLWAVVLNFGYIASVVGLVIGWLAATGYNLLRGKQGKGKVVILIFAVIFGVLLGTFAADAYTLWGMIRDGTLYGYAVSDIPRLIVFLLGADHEYLTATLSNVGLGLLFAGLGVFALLRRTGKEVAGTKVKDLDRPE